jgi:hypothetical protein
LIERRPSGLPHPGVRSAGIAQAMSAVCVFPVPFHETQSARFAVPLKQQITDDMKTAMKSGEKDRLGVIRLILAAIKQREVDERIVLDDAQVLSVIEKMIKQRRDSITQFRAAAREDLATKEEYEVGVIQAYMPAQLGDAEIDAIIAKAIADSGAASAKDMGKVIGLVRPQVAGRADMGAISGAVKAKLGLMG